MASLMDRLRLVGAPKQPTQPAQVVQKAAQKPVNARRAVRAWRVLLDKVFTLMQMVALQDAIGDWCPQSSGQASLPSSVPTVEDTYAQLILEARPLKPLQSKSPPSTAASACIHPKHQLKGGGNQTQSYIVCRECNSRWEMPFRAKEVRQEVKQQKGLLGQMMKNMPVASAPMEVEPGLEPQWEMQNVKTPAWEMQNASTQAAIFAEQMKKHIDMRVKEFSDAAVRSQAASSQQDFQQMALMGQEMQRMLNEVKEKELKQEATFQAIMKNVVTPAAQSPIPQSPGRMSEGSMPSTAAATPFRMEASGRMKRPMCKCNQMAEQLVVKKEGPRKGRTFWKCVQRQCDFFLWDQLPPEVPALPGTQRTKSPKRSVTELGSWTQVVDLLSDEDNL